MIAKKPYNQDMVTTTFKKLIHSMPSPNRYLLLYVVELLAVFSRKADKNLMTARSIHPSYPFVLLPYLTAAILCFTDLAVIFCPALMSHPAHEHRLTEHRLSQEVLEFLITYQNWLILGTPFPIPQSPTPSSSLTPPSSPGAR